MPDIHARAGQALPHLAGAGTDVQPDPEPVEYLRRRAFRALERPSGIEPETALLDLQEQVIPYDRLLLRHGDRMTAALERVERIRDQDLPQLSAYDLHYLRLCHEVENLTLAAELHLKASMRRTETRNILREDYPYTDNESWLKWIMVRTDDGAQSWWTEDIPIESYPWRPERKKELAYLWQRPLDVGVVSVEDNRIRWNEE